MEQGEIAQDGGKNVVEVMGKATGKGADGFHLLGLPQLLFLVFQLGDVIEADGHPGGAVGNQGKKGQVVEVLGILAHLFAMEDHRIPAAVGLIDLLGVFAEERGNIIDLSADCLMGGDAGELAGRGIPLGNRGIGVQGNEHGGHGLDDVVQIVANSGNLALRGLLFGDVTDQPLVFGHSPVKPPDHMAGQGGNDGGAVVCDKGQLVILGKPLGVYLLLELGKSLLIFENAGKQVPAEHGLPRNLAHDENERRIYIKELSFFVGHENPLHGPFEKMPEFFFRILERQLPGGYGGGHDAQGEGKTLQLQHPSGGRDLHIEVTLADAVGYLHESPNRFAHALGQQRADQNSKNPEAKARQRCVSLHLMQMGEDRFHGQGNPGYSKHHLANGNGGDYHHLFTGGVDRNS